MIFVSIVFITVFFIAVVFMVQTHYRSNRQSQSIGEFGDAHAYASYKHGQKNWNVPPYSPPPLHRIGKEVLQNLYVHCEDELQCMQNMAVN